MTITREAIGDAVQRWEKKAKDEMFLDAFLHPMARQWLLDEIVVALKSHAQSAAESSEVESSRVESTQMLMAGKRDPAVADINDISPRWNGGITLPPEMLPRAGEDGADVIVVDPDTDEQTLIDPDTGKGRVITPRNRKKGH